MSSGGKPSWAGVLRWLKNKIVYSVGFGLALLFLISLALFHYSDFLKPKPDVVRIAYSAGAPLRRHFLEEMALAGRHWNLDIQLIPAENTDAILSKIDRNTADMAIITGGIVDRAHRSVLEVTPLYMEPLQLLVKAELHDAIAADFGQLKGRTIGLEGVQSATNVMAGELLRFIGLNDPATGRPLYRPVYIPQSQVLTQDTAAMPDAIFQIGGVPSATVERLVADHDYRLVALPFGDSFNLSEFRESEAPKQPADQRLALDKTFVEEAVIPAYVYGVLPPVPAAATRTIATRSLLVGGEHLKAEVVKRVLGLVMSPDVSQVVEPQLTVKLLESEFQFKRHPGTEAYLESLKPLDVEGALSGYQRIAEIWGILVAAYLTATNGWKWWKERREGKAKQSVGHFLSQILEVEAGLRGAHTEADRRHLDQRLNDIKKQSIELHLDGRLEDAEHFQSLLVALADTRSQIWGAAN